MILNRFIWPDDLKGSKESEHTSSSGYGVRAFLSADQQFRMNLKRHKHITGPRGLKPAHGGG